MSDAPQFYLITPDRIELSAFSGTLAGVLDAVEVACVRLAMASADEGEVRRAADVIRDLCHQRDVPVVIADHMRLVEPHGLDGVHLTTPKNIREARGAIGKDAILGVFCGASKHEGLTSGEAGADYVSFGPVTASALGDGETAGMDLFEFWSAFVEVPLVVEGGLDDAAIGRVSGLVDFLALGPEIWQADDPAARLGDIRSAL